MPTALTTSTSREDLIEATILLGALAAQTPRPDRKLLMSSANRLAVLTGRYLNTLRINPDTGEEEHDELHNAAVRLIDCGVKVGMLASSRTAHADGSLMMAADACGPAALAYLRTMERQHSL